MKVALAHDWLTGMRGGEKVLEVICELWPEADLYTLLYVKGALSPIIENRNIHTSFVQKLPKAATWYRNYLPLFPWAVSRFDLSGYDLVISTSHCVVKGIETGNACHISYVHTPMRYVWELFDDYFGPGRMPIHKRLVARAVRPLLQRWDVKTADRVDYYIANSHHVRKRIKRHYNRDAEVINPPVDLEGFGIADKIGDYYLIVSAFAPYKRIDLALEAFKRLGYPLKVVGGGQDESKLLAYKAPNIEFLGRKEDDELKKLYAGCRAFIFPGEEDFGITPLEAQASGRPVIAYGKGGALETVAGVYPGAMQTEELCTGVFFKEQTVDALCEAVKYYEDKSPCSSPDKVREHVLDFDRPLMAKRLKEFVQAKFLEYEKTGSG